MKSVKLSRKQLRDLLEEASIRSDRNETMAIVKYLAGTAMRDDHVELAQQVAFNINTGLEQLFAGTKWGAILTQAKEICDIVDLVGQGEFGNVPNQRRKGR